MSVESPNLERKRSHRPRSIALALGGLLFGNVMLAPSADSGSFNEPQKIEPQVELAPISEKEVVGNAVSTNHIKNVLLVVMDDVQDSACADTEEYFPKSSKWLYNPGVSGTCYEHAITPDPVCCPARTIIMSGQYPHNNGVRRQIDSEFFNADTTVQHVLDESGMDTFGIGKFLNGTQDADIARGIFDTGFQANKFFNDYTHFNPRLINAKGNYYHPGKNVHTTEITANGTRNFIRESDANDGWFIYQADYASHDEKTNRGKGLWPKPTAAHDNAAVKTFKPVYEADRRDKHPLMQRNDLLKKRLLAKYTEKAQSVYDIDAQLAKTFRLLQKRQLLAKTAVFLVSDNGYTFSNAWNGKGVPESVDIPMYASIPGISEGTIDTRPVNLTDIAATAYDIKDVKPGYALDGHSLLSNYTRTWQFAEYTEEHSQLMIDESGSQSADVPSWRALYGNGIYVEYIKEENDKTIVLRKEYYAADDTLMQNNLLHKSHADQAPSVELILNRHRRLVRLTKCQKTLATTATNPCT